MNFIISFLLLGFCSVGQGQSPLSTFSDEWNDSVYTKANTVSSIDYMSAEEKKVIHILNLMRLNPQLFLKTVVMKYPSLSMYPSLETSPYFISLVSTLENQKPLPLLFPNQKCFTSADCHAITSGRKGYVGHERQLEECKTKQFFSGECCSYGYNNAIDIVLTLLIDKGVPGLGHRINLLSNYKTCGVSIQPHKKYVYNAVIDFNY